MPSLLLLGDLTPAGVTHVEWDSIDDASLTLANLETPLCGEQILIAPKAGPHLRGDPIVLSSLRRPFAQFVVSLANNHAMDHGVEGLRETIDVCRQAGVLHVGAGEDIEQASAPLFLTVEGLRIGVLGLCERQFGLATRDRPGVAPLDPGIFTRIAAARRQCDRIIVSIHGAAEMSAWPAPRWQMLLRALVDAGADWVHGHHAHLAQGIERHGAGWIVYSAGNSVVNPALWPEGDLVLQSWQIRFDLSQPSKAPLVESWRVKAVSTGTVHATREPLPKAHFDACNSPLSNPVLLEALWQEYSLQLWHDFYSPALGLSEKTKLRLRQILESGRGEIRRILASRSAGRHQLAQALFHYHLFACEHHADAIATALAVLTGQTPDYRSRESRQLAAVWLPPTPSS